MPKLTQSVHTIAVVSKLAPVNAYHFCGVKTGSSQYIPWLLSQNWPQSVHTVAELSNLAPVITHHGSGVKLFAVSTHHGCGVKTGLSQYTP